MLELDSVSKTFSTNGYGVKAVDSVTLGVSRGDFVWIQGPNGSGKTTLLDIIGGDEYPDAGRVVWKGSDVTRMPAYRRPFVGRIFQDPHEASCDELTILDTLCLAQIGMRPSAFRRAVNRHRRALAENEIKSAGLGHLADRLLEPLGNLSGGERQIVNILFLKVRRPTAEIILADEPTNHLDPENASRALDLLSRLAESRAVLLVSHMPPIRPSVTAVVRMERGRLCQEEEIGATRR